jgi:ubiquinone/menaquinone biosynthesis C-methylase UbiE
MDTLDSEAGAQRSSAADRERHDAQGHVNTYFDSASAYWDAVYKEDDLQGLIYRSRQAAVLAYVDAVEPPAQASALEIGCGAGHLTVQLAKRGLQVDAVDASNEMVKATADRARDAGFGERVHVDLADVHALPFGAGHFDLVVAVGVIPWLHSPDGAVKEMARVLRQGGQLVLTADNRARLTSFSDPREMLALTPLRRVYHALRPRHGVAMSRLDSPRRVDGFLIDAGLRPVERRTVGFGPMSFLRRPIFSDARGIRIDRRLQSLADRGVPGLQWTGWHYVVRAEKLD